MMKIITKAGLKSLLSFLILLAFPLSYSFSQEKLGIANSNYQSTSSIFLNPSSSVDSRTFIQFNLIGINAYAYTNQVYLPDFSIPRAIGGYHEQPYIVTSKWKKFLYGNFAVDAPALVVSHRRIGIGFFIRGRAEADVRRMPYELTKLFIPGEVDTSVAPTAVNFNIRNAKISTMSWAEYGLNFGTMVKKRNGLLITAGGNLKYLTGINLLYANLSRFDGYLVDTLIDVKSLKGKIRMASPAWGAGKGFGTDLGITYRRALKSETEYEGYYVNSKRSNCEHIDYLYKVGISLLDLGYIKYDAKTLKADVDGSLYIANYNDVEHADELIQANFSPVVKRNVPITAVLPTALSVQLDMNMSHHIYLNGTVIKSVIPTFVPGVQRANLLSITPRYERSQFEVAMPLTFHRFIYPQLGFAFRYRTFVFGMDNLFPLFLPKKTYGLNVYFSLGISLFKNPACKTKHYRKKKEKVVKRETTNCPKFGKRNILGF